MNTAIISGNLCADPEAHTTSNGISQVVIRLGVTRDYKDSKTGKRETDFINCVVWRQAADFLAKNARKGDSVTVRGAIQTRSYEKDGVKRTITEINADRVELNKKRENPQTADSADDFREVDPGDGLPF